MITKLCYTLVNSLIWKDWELDLESALESYFAVPTAISIPCFIDCSWRCNFLAALVAGGSLSLFRAYEVGGVWSWHRNGIRIWHGPKPRIWEHVSVPHFRCRQKGCNYTAYFPRNWMIIFYIYFMDIYHIICIIYAAS